MTNYLIFKFTNTLSNIKKIGLTTSDISKIVEGIKKTLEVL